MLHNKRLAVIGVGMMGNALAQGLVRAGAMPASHIILYDPHLARAQSVASDLQHATIAADEREAAEQADIVLFAVKPYVIHESVSRIAKQLSSAKLVISIAAGVRIAQIEALVPSNVPIVRAMPNTPALVGAGVTAIAAGTHATHDHLEQAATLFRAIGKVVTVEERLMDAVTGLSGSGPAYVYLFIEALMDGGVREGLTRDTARMLAAQTVFGAAKMVLESTDHPAQLKDNVTTPGGTTIAGLAVLEKAGLRTAVMDAVQAASARSRELS
jgi:pyrroline-5-carboxylate reductase